MQLICKKGLAANKVYLLFIQHVTKIAGQATTMRHRIKFIYWEDFFIYSIEISDKQSQI
jgi:hypothetical protein